MAVFHRWTKEMEQLIIDNYKTTGDYLLAEMMNEKFPHKYRWKVKHIEKKRGYLKLKRTKEEEMFLRWFANNILKDFQDSHNKAWDKRGRAKIGEVRIWEGKEFIKTETGFVPLNVFTWEKEYGPAPKGFNIVRKSKAITAGDINNLELVSNMDLAARNSIHRYPPELRSAIMTLSRLKRKINKHEEQTK